MDLTQIRYFLAVARTLNFTRAAADCGVTQPALSRGIQRLEEVLGGPLILRERSLTQLTEFGRTMLPLLQQTYDAAEAVRHRAERHRRHQDEAPLRLGICPFLAMGPFLTPLRSVAEAIEGAVVEIRRGAEPLLLDWLMSGAIDVAVMPQFRPLPERLRHWPLWSQGLEAWLPASHPLARESGPLPLQTLRDEPMVALAVDPAADAARALARERLGIRGPRRHAASGPEEVAAMVALGLGWGIAPEGTATPPGVHARPLVDEPPIALQVILISVAGRPANRAVQHFQRLVRARFAAISAA